MLFSLMSVAVFLVSSCPQHKKTATNLHRPAVWRQVVTKIGAFVQLPPDLTLASVDRSPESQIVDGKWVGLRGAETYQSKDGKRGFALAQMPIPSDEEAKESVATKIEDIVFKQLVLGEDKLSAIRYRARQGWPTLDMDVAVAPDRKLPIGGKLADVPTAYPLRYLVYRTDTTYFVAQIFGGVAMTDRQKIVDSFRLPKEAGSGRFETWGPLPSKQVMFDSHVELWTLGELKEVKDAQDNNKGPQDKTLQIEFGYVSLTVDSRALPKGYGAEMGEDGLDEMLKTVAQDARDPDDKDELSFSDFKTYNSNLTNFRFVTVRDGTLDARIDAGVKGDTAYFFTLYVPHGMLDSPEIKKVIASYTIQ